MLLKATPEDFVVQEVATHATLPDGPYLLLEISKRNLTTERVASELADRLGVPRKGVGYAGAKDSRALTRQYMTVRDGQGILERLKNLRPGAWSARHVGYLKEPLGLGMLEGNRFEITCRKLTKDEQLHPMRSIPNLFDEQRFSTANAIIGRHLLKGEFLDAANLIIRTDPEATNRVKEHLENRPNDAVSALRFVPKNLLLMYVHSYQSSLWNEVLSRWIREQDPDAVLIPGPVPITVPTKELENTVIPMVGFSDELEEPFAGWYAELLARDNLTQRDFVVRQLPFLTLEGGRRQAFLGILDLHAEPRESDDLNPGFEKQRVTFRLQKAAYATMALKCLYRTGRVDGG